VAEPLPPIGFWSYTSSDDTASGGRLSQLRRRLADELQLRIGQRPKVYLWQDVAAIPHGADWQQEIHKALDQSSFLIPIVTPAFLQSEWCCKEVLHFRQREQALGRGDLIFPFRYIDVSDIESHEVHDPVVLALLKARQWIDFTPFRYRSPEIEEVASLLGSLAASLRAALRRAPPPPPAELTLRGMAPPRSPDPPPELPRPAIIAPSPPAFPIPETVLIPVGTFQMGAPEAESKREGTEDWDKDASPMHEVTIAKPFWLGKYPVTRGEFAAFAADTGRDGEPWASPGFAQDDRHPVVRVSHADALAYLGWPSQKTGQTWRLPSEAEWEYAARAGTTTARYWGNAAGKPGEHAHFASSDGTCPAGSFPPNRFGLHDMLGNVWEWTADAWHDNYRGAPADGSVWMAAGEADRVVRGGSWRNVARAVRAAGRNHYAPANRYGDFGFRPARVQGP